MTDCICFEFDATINRDKNILIPLHETHQDLAANISFPSLSCECCWSVYLPIEYEYKYREWLNDKGICIKSVKYINGLHNETARWIMLDNMEKEACTLLNQITNENETNTQQTASYTLKYIVTDNPDASYIHTFTGDNYKDFISQLGNWGISNNMFTKRGFNKELKEGFKNGINGTKYKLFDLHINGKPEVVCTICTGES